MLIMTSHRRNVLIGNNSCPDNDESQDWGTSATSMSGKAEGLRFYESHRHTIADRIPTGTTSEISSSSGPMTSSFDPPVSLGPSMSSSSVASPFLETSNQMSSLKFPFPWKLHQLLDEAEKNGNESIISWLPKPGSGFQVHLPDEFTNIIMPSYFKQTKYKSFTRQVRFQHCSSSNGALRLSLHSSHTLLFT